jgi:hypothetical protein
MLSAGHPRQQTARVVGTDKQRDAIQCSVCSIQARRRGTRYSQNNP